MDRQESKNDNLKSFIADVEKQILKEFKVDLSDVGAQVRLKFALCASVCGAVSRIVYRKGGISDFQRKLLVREIQKVFYDTCPKNIITTAENVLIDIDTYECLVFSKSEFLRYYKRHSFSLEFEVNFDVIYDELMVAFFFDAANYVAKDYHGEIQRSAYLIRDILIGEPGDTESDLELMSANPNVKLLVSNLSERLIDCIDF